MTFSSNRFKIIYLIFYYLGAVLVGFVLYKYYWMKTKDRDNPLVETKLGTIEGLWASDGDYSMFMGIPYAVVNESNPFGQFIPFPKFEGVFQAHDDSAMCPQKEEVNKTIVGSLDCLHLNIYVPNSASSDNPLSVLVFIYGGKYDFGFAGRYFYGPKYLVKKDIILVVFNYRLGPYGFLCLNTPDIPGNQGHKDQIAALKWINDNIESFGGDPNKITVSGASSGGQNVFLHLLYEKELLFNQIIILSGLISPPLIMMEADVDVPEAIAADLGFKTNNMDEALKFLTTKKSDSIIRSSKKLNIDYNPCVEEKFNNVDRFISDYTVNMVDVPNIKKVSILVEQTSNERLYLYANTDLNEPEYKNIFREAINSQFELDNDTLRKMEDYIHRFYVGHGNISEYVKQNIIGFTSDLLDYYPTKRVIDKFLKNDAKKVYYNIFSYVGERNFIRDAYQVNKSYKGSSHNDEIGYLFDVSYMKDRNRYEDMVIVDRITTLWANFVKYGDPTPETTDLLPMKWEPVSKNTYAYYNINTDVTIGVNPFQERMTFWEQFYKWNGKFERLISTK